MNFKAILPMRSAWIGAGVLAFFSVYFALSGFGVPEPNNGASLARSVAILSVPKPAVNLAAPVQNSRTQPTSSTSSGGHLVEVESATPVFKYSDESNQFALSNDWQSAPSASLPGSTTTSSILPQPVDKSSDSKSVTRENSGDGETHNSESAVNSPSEHLPIVSTSSSTSTTTTVPSNGGNDSHDGSDN